MGLEILVRTIIIKEIKNIKINNMEVKIIIANFLDLVPKVGKVDINKIGNQIIKMEAIGKMGTKTTIMEVLAEL